MRRTWLPVLAICGLTACTNANDLDEPPAPLGDFRLSHNIVVAPNAVKGPLSRNATEEEWQEVLTGAIDDRFGRYEGEKLYHFGVAVLGYVLAQPGVPVVASPKSVLILSLDVWDDAKGHRLQEEPEQITVLETFSGDTFIGSGLTQSREKQMDHLSRNAAKQIETYLLRKQKEEAWFGQIVEEEAEKPVETPETSDSEDGQNATDA